MALTVVFMSQVLFTLIPTYFVCLLLASDQKLVYFASRSHHESFAKVLIQIADLFLFPCSALYLTLYSWKTDATNNTFNQERFSTVSIFAYALSKKLRNAQYEQANTLAILAIPIICI